MRIILLVLLLYVPCLGGNTVDSVGDMMEQVRQATLLESDTFLPDTTLRRACLVGLVYTSTDIGGIEAMHRVVTVSDECWYDLPDSTTEIVSATVRALYGTTKSVKAWYPQFFEDLQIPEGDPMEQNDDGVPSHYHHWADSVQLLPCPVRDDDTMIFKIYVEHPTGSYTDANTDTIQIQFTADAYAQAAIDYACKEAMKSVKKYDEAAYFQSEYDKKKADLRAVFTRKFDIVK